MIKQGDVKEGDRIYWIGPYYVHSDLVEDVQESGFKAGTRYYQWGQRGVYRSKTWAWCAKYVPAAAWHAAVVAFVIAMGVAACMLAGWAFHTGWELAS